MSRSVNRNVKQRKIHMIILIALILLCTILGGGYYLLKQTKENSEKTNRPKQSAQTSADSAQDSNTVEYKGETYKYNDHLSNYLFMGIDTRDAVDTYQTQEDAGQADANNLHAWTSTAASGSSHRAFTADKEGTG